MVNLKYEDGLLDVYDANEQLDKVITKYIEGSSNYGIARRELSFLWLAAMKLGMSQPININFLQEKSI
ncbi:hypothetical protein [Neobacillus cucumis]|uniref:hypothetical protein n=1 Tax=Neobacillus cucumis TaxID=1740721 RepID=UPI00285322F3|nr:hypothetical protein [Neobacillus cucumis]MDR4949889.1 hypothetical protein [Neobacillus cucumis]